MSEDAVEKYTEAEKVSEMERTNTFIVEHHPTLWELADNCSYNTPKSALFPLFFQQRTLQDFPI
jgi:hypothetical protein